MGLVIQSWLRLVYFDFLMQFRGFPAVQTSVRSRVPRRCSLPAGPKAICHAVDLACVFYFKRVLCLQRSAATTVLLRQHGWAAEMLIGAQLMPFESHAWVELDGKVVNDKPYIGEIFQTLDRC
jgi:hypothetical protein